MSTVLWLLLGCTVHVGVAPLASSWRVAEIEAPVVEPEIASWMREALTTALATRGALAPSGAPLIVTVTEAAWAPSRRSGDALLYEGRLTVLVTAGERSWTRSRTWSAVDPGGAGASRAAREDTFRTLSRLVAEDVVGGL